MSDPAPIDPRPAWLIPLAERKRRNASLPRRNTTPLSEDEKRQLRDRLNAPSGAQTPLQAREYTAWMHMTVIRTPEAIQELVAQVREGSKRSDDDGRHYARGILQAVAWATGEVREGPITGRVPEGPLPTVSEMEDEERAAVRVLRWQQESVLHRHFVSGVEACLLWLRAGGDDPPW